MEWYSKRRFGDLADEAAGRFGDREALVYQDERYSFRDIQREVDRAAKGLMARGVERGDHVALWLNNCAEWMFISCALAKVGVVQVPINTRFRTTDLEYVLRQSDSAYLITHDISGPIDYLEMVREV
ncbi:MAG: AMP-binding protein, partial [Alphaproteobacteria bacterium]|nr:AMP-binding protein [Alphaproteobacteria bacterium]